VSFCPRYTEEVRRGAERYDENVRIDWTLGCLDPPRWKVDCEYLGTEVVYAALKYPCERNASVVSLNLLRYHFRQARYELMAFATVDQSNRPRAIESNSQFPRGPYTGIPSAYDTYGRHVCPLPASFSKIRYLARFWW
jgi:hypothetical protein